MKDNILLNADDLYKKSQIFYEDTVHNINLAKTRPKLEDAALDVACFDVQQVIELMLKTILAKNQISFDKKEGHDIKYLLDLVTKNTDLASSKTEALIPSSRLSSYVSTNVAVKPLSLDMGI